MKAIQYTEHGSVEVLKLADVAVPTPAADEVLVRVKAAGLNFIDIYLRSGRYPSPLPSIPGREGAGIVEAVGSNVTDIKPGTRVAWVNGMNAGGAWAEYCTVPAVQLISLPDDISFVQGAAFPLQGMTAQYLLHEFYKIKPGDTVLVHAAAGGMGLLLVQWLKHMRARVIGTVSTPEKAALARAAGADEIIFYTKEDFVAKTKELTHGVGADYIIDGVGKTTFSKDLEAVRTRGHITLFGSASGPAEPLAPNSLQARALTVLGGSLFNFMNTAAEIQQRANSVLEGIRDGWLKLNIDHVYALENAREAQRKLESRQSTGKLVLEI